MCLSNVYQDEQSEDHLLASDVATIESDGGMVTLTDLFGRKLAVKGLLKRADLVGGVVILQVDP